MAGPVRARIRCAWQNWPGAPGVTDFYYGSDLGFQPNQADLDAIRAFFNALVTYLPNNLTIQVPSSGDAIDTTDGSLVDTWGPLTAPAVVTGTSSAAYAGNAGMCVHWLTSEVIEGRRLRGRSFLVPLTSLAFENNGSPAAAAVTALTNAANTLRTAGSGGLVVWSRPKYNTAVPKPYPIVRTGSAHPITGVRVPDLAISLRSRRV